MSAVVIQADELLPCPFCGHEAVFEQVGSFAQQGGCAWSVGCTNEECLGFQSVTTYARKCEAATAWNTRTQATEQKDAIIEELVGVLEEALDSLTTAGVLVPGDIHQNDPVLAKIQAALSKVRSPIGLGGGG